MISTERTRHGMSAVLSGQRKGFASKLLFVGPAVIASIAYVDPGNYATNIQAGAGYGYLLLWVVLLANLIAMLFQALSARLGIVTGKNLAEMSRDNFSRPVVWAMWGVSEVAAMATDLAEFLGGAIGLALLFNLPLVWGMVVTAIVTYGILIFESRGFRPMELIIGTMVAIIGLCYLVEVFIARIDWGAAAVGLVSPQLPDASALTISVGIIGATVMPHAVYLHSGLTQNRVAIRHDADRRKVLRYSNIEVVFALAVAGLVNMAMVMMAASAFHLGHSDVAEIETAYHTLTPLLGAAAASVFLVSLITSGVSSSIVGTMAGQMIIAGLPAVPRAGLAAAARHHGAGLRRGRDGGERDPGAGAQPGGAVDRAAGADDRADYLHRAPRHHGRFRDRADDAAPGADRRRGGAGAERRAAGAGLRRTDPVPRRLTMARKR